MDWAPRHTALAGRLNLAAVILVAAIQAGSYVASTAHSLWCHTDHGGTSLVK
jgi:hypothetical protein